ncbi:MAG: hypothetical protein R3D84_16225 [Paracoccaceae bacterium]
MPETLSRSLSQTLERIAAPAAAPRGPLFGTRAGLFALLRAEALPGPDGPESEARPDGPESEARPEGPETEAGPEGPKTGPEARTEVRTEAGPRPRAVDPGQGQNSGQNPGRRAAPAPVPAWAKGPRRRPAASGVKAPTAETPAVTTPAVTTPAIATPAPSWREAELGDLFVFRGP